VLPPGRILIRSRADRRVFSAKTPFEKHRFLLFPFLNTVFSNLQLWQLPQKNTGAAKISVKIRDRENSSVKSVFRPCFAWANPHAARP
jgi:hypothetical protein